MHDEILEQEAREQLRGQGADDEPMEDARETCCFWNARAGECRYEMQFPGCEPCADCPGTEETAKQARADLILDTVDALVDRLLVVDRECDDELHPGDIEAAIVKGDVTVETMIHRFAAVLRARTP